MVEKRKRCISGSVFIIDIQSFFSADTCYTASDIINTENFLLFLVCFLTSIALSHCVLKKCMEVVKIDLFAFLLH